MSQRKRKAISAQQWVRILRQAADEGGEVDGKFLATVLKSRELDPRARQEMERLQRDAARTVAPGFTSTQGLRGQTSGSSNKQTERATKEVMAGLRATPIRFPTGAFFNAPAISLEAHGAEELIRVLSDKYGDESLPVSPDARHRTESSGEQYRAKLQWFDAYRPFHEADDRILEYYGKLIRKTITNSLCRDLGANNGIQTEKLFRHAGRPAFYEGMELVRDYIPELRSNLSSYFTNPDHLRTIIADFCNPAFWGADVRKQWEMAKKEQGLSRVTIWMLGLTIGNFFNPALRSLFFNISSTMGPEDILVISNNAMGTRGDLGFYNIEKEIEQMNAGYRAPAIYPFIHCVLDSHLRMANLAGINHRDGTVTVGFNRETTTNERKMVFKKPQSVYMRGARRPLAKVGEIQFPGSQTRSIREISDHAQETGMKLIEVMPDPYGQTRIALLAFAHHQSPLTCLPR